MVLAVWKGEWGKIRPGDTGEGGLEHKDLRGDNLGNMEGEMVPSELEMDGEFSGGLGTTVEIAEIMGDTVL